MDLPPPPPTTDSAVEREMLPWGDGAGEITNETHGQRKQFVTAKND